MNLTPFTAPLHHSRHPHLSDVFPAMKVRDGHGTAALLQEPIDLGQLGTKLDLPKSGGKPN